MRSKHQGGNLGSFRRIHVFAYPLPLVKNSPLGPLPSMADSRRRVDLSFVALPKRLHEVGLSKNRPDYTDSTTPCPAKLSISDIQQNPLPGGAKRDSWTRRR